MTNWLADGSTSRLANWRKIMRTDAVSSQGTGLNCLSCTTEGPAINSLCPGMHSIGYMPTSTSVLKCPLVLSLDLALFLATNKSKKSQQASFWLYPFKPQTVSTDQPEKKNGYQKRARTNCCVKKRWFALWLNGTLCDIYSEWACI